MDYVGGLHEVEEDGKLFLVYQHRKYQTIPQTQRSTSSGEVASDVVKLLFLCPHARRRNLGSNSDRNIFPVDYSPMYVLSTTSTQQDKPSLGERFADHPVHPLSSYKKPDIIGDCPFCYGSNSGKSYYFCETHQYTYHKECVESPPQIFKNPYHPQHTLQLYFHYCSDPETMCFCCGRRVNYLVYQCTICQIFMHPTCVLNIPFIIDPPKRHHHPLTLFPRQSSLTCNVCGLLREVYPTYICARCNFVAHIDCMHSPHIIKISRHRHRISYCSSLLSEELSCGVCRQSIDSAYGAYTCDKCGDYAVHARCALRKDVWDGLEHEGLLEEDDITQDAGPFEIISEGVIQHFLHDHHHLRLKINILYDENKFCAACVLPIYEGSFYSCMECDFILHETCAKARRRIQHALHPHPLTLKNEIFGNGDSFRCNACDRFCVSFVYECHKGECNFDLDVRCALTSEPFDYGGHEHPLFFALGPDEKPICQVCKSESHIPLNCIKCDFIVCMKCATLPYKARYKHDKHFLRVVCGDEVCEKDWCEACERNLGDTDTKVFYWCNECCTTLHIECLLGKDLYVKPGKNFESNNKVFEIHGKSNLSRPRCHSCKNPCQGKLFKSWLYIACSESCASKVLLCNLFHMHRFRL